MKIRRPFFFFGEKGFFYAEGDFDFEQTKRDIHTELADFQAALPGVGGFSTSNL